MCMRAFLYFVRAVRPLQSGVCRARRFAAAQKASRAFFSESPSERDEITSCSLCVCVCAAHRNNAAAAVEGRPHVTTSTETQEQTGLLLFSLSLSFAFLCSRRRRRRQRRRARTHEKKCDLSQPHLAKSTAFCMASGRYVTSILKGREPLFLTDKEFF